MSKKTRKKSSKGSSTNSAPKATTTKAARGGSKAPAKTPAAKARKAVAKKAGKAAKTIVAKAGKGVTIKSLEVTSSTPDFTTKVEPGSTAGEFKILVQPKETAHQSTANLVIKPDKAAGENKVFNASARVMPSSS